MKLLFCTICHDVLRLTRAERACVCGRCRGLYTDGTNAEVWGPNLVLGFSNWSFAEAIAAQLERGDLDEPMGGIYGSLPRGRVFEAFIIPDVCPSVRRHP